MKLPVWIIPVLLTGALVLGFMAAQAGTEAPDSWQDRLAEGAEPKAVAVALPAESLTDLQALNALRLRLKAEGKAAVAESFFAALAGRDATDAVLLNLSLAYIDQMMGKNLLQQGNLSTRSQEVVEQIIKRKADHWVAWYIRGINNLYWPDWFVRRRSRGSISPKPLPFTNACPRSSRTRTTTMPWAT
jgi:Flp pilus assembly protein CpaB